MRLFLLTHPWLSTPIPTFDTVNYLPIQSASFLVGTTDGRSLCRDVKPTRKANEAHERQPRQERTSVRRAKRSQPFKTSRMESLPGLKGQRSEGAWKGSRTPGGFHFRSHQNSRASSQRRRRSRTIPLGDIGMPWVVQQEGSAILSYLSRGIHCG